MSYFPEGFVLIDFMGGSTDTFCMVLNLLATSVATLGVGKIPRAPGTFGSLLAVLVWWASFPLPLELQLLLIFLAFGLGWVATHFYEKWSHKHDPKEVVVDELIGMWITLLGASQNWVIFLLGFLLFRLFDICKPFPIGWIDQKVPGALGTILDDVVAGVFAYILLNITIFLGNDFAIFH